MYGIYEAQCNMAARVCDVCGIGLGSRLTVCLQDQPLGLLTVICELRS
jgi:hypothetical protein